MRYVVIGLGTFGMQIVRTLSENGAEVIAIDRNSHQVDQIKETAALAMGLDSTDEAAMNASEIDDADAAVVALGNAQEEAILTTVILKKMGIHPIIARATNDLYAHVLRQVGADEVIIIEEQAGVDVARKLLAPEVHEKIMLTSGHSLVELEARPEFVGRSLKSLDFRNRYHVNVIAIQRRETLIDDSGRVTEKVMMNDLPGPDDLIAKGDVLMIVGSEADIEQLTLEKRE